MSEGTAVGFDGWYRSAHRQVLAALVSYCGSVPDAEDAVDEAFARACERWDRVGRMASPTGWVFVVARNHLRRSRRRGSARTGPGRSEVTEQPDESGRVDMALEVAAALARLTPRQREVVVLHHGLDLAQEQVAVVLGIARSTVATTLRDARLALESTDPGREAAPEHEGTR